MGGHETRPAPLQEGPPAMARWIFQALGATMVSLPLAALGMFIALP
jgi:hypothetical protein